MSSLTRAFLNATTFGSSSALRSNKTSTAHGRVEPEKRAASDPEEDSDLSANRPGLIFDNEQIEQFVRETIDDSIFESSTAIRQAVEVDYDTSRILNLKVRQLVEDVYELRPKYEPLSLQEREGTVSLLEILQESGIEPSKQLRQVRSSEEPEPTVSLSGMLEERAIKPSKQLRSVPSSRKSLHAPALFASLRKTSSFLRPRSAGLNRESALKSPRVEPRVFEDHINSPITSPLIAREAAPNISTIPRPKTAFVSTSITPYDALSRSEEYPPDTPDRPAPLNVKLHTKASQSPSSLSRALPPLPDGLSPVLSTPSKSSSSRHMLPSKDNILPPQYTRQPRSAVNEDSFISEVDDSAARCKFVGTTTCKITDGATPGFDDLLEDLEATLKPIPSAPSKPSSVYSDTHEPKPDSDIANGIAESRHDTLVEEEENARASQCTSNTADSEADWETVQEIESEREDRRSHHSYYNSHGFLLQESDLQKEDDCAASLTDSIFGFGVQSGLPQSPYPPRRDSLLKLTTIINERKESRIPVPKVPADKRAAAVQARKEAEEANRAAMSGFHRPLPLRSYESQAFPAMKENGFGERKRSSSLEVRTARSFTPLAPPTAPCDLAIASSVVASGIAGLSVGPEEEYDDDGMTEAAEDGERLVMSDGHRCECVRCGAKWQGDYRV
ncbi:hypothetical protein SLS60_001050 [Paraconiothyrium brasiliense]|uniref:Uncharacterized protein n=1 Tax=Paraconiothyrium brasiliense TaxID=300254 RepID=A0ABR3S803_9PLEO